MTTFFVLAALMTLAAVGIVLLGARSPKRVERLSRVDMNVSVLRQQLRDLALERERGALSPVEFEQARDELQRRLIDDTDPGPVLPAVCGLRWPPVAVAAAVPVLAASLYIAFGNPNALQRIELPEPQVAASADAALAQRAQLEAHVVSSPDDARAWVLLARLRLDADQFEPAAAAYAKAIDLSPRKVASDAQVWAEYADALGMTQGGSLAGKPRAAIDKALALDPRHPKALELAGSAAVEARDFRAAHAAWLALLQQLPQDSPQRLPLRAALEKVERLAQFALPSS